MNVEVLDPSSTFSTSLAHCAADFDWIDVCDINDIAPNTGVCAKVNKQQVAIFYLHPENELRAFNNFDPIAEANILSRGLLAEIDGKRVVASPLYKQHYCLQSGQCLQDDNKQIAIYQARIKDGRVQLFINSKETQQ